MFGVPAETFDSVRRIDNAIVILLRPCSATQRRHTAQHSRLAAGLPDLEQGEPVAVGAVGVAHGLDLAGGGDVGPRAAEHRP